MKSKILAGVFILTLFSSGYVLAVEGDTMMAAPAGAEKAVTETTSAVKMCPMDGMPIAEGKGVTVEYNGKTYTLCSAMCAKAFQDNPEAAIRKMEAMQAPMGDMKKDMMGDMKEDMGDMKEDMGDMNEETGGMQDMGDEMKGDDMGGGMMEKK